MQSARARHLRIQVHQESGITVVVPKSFSRDEALKCVQNKKHWIEKHSRKFNKLKKTSTIFTNELNFKTRFHSLRLLQHNSAKLKTSISGGIIKVWYPNHVECTHERVQEFTRFAIEEALRIEKKKTIPERVAYYAEQYGFKYNSVKIRRASTRWGSCSNKGNLNFNLHLMRLPNELIDYVILHELCHTAHMNHSKLFWALLERCLPGAKRLDKKLNTYNLKYW